MAGQLSCVLSFLALNFAEVLLSKGEAVDLTALERRYNFQRTSSTMAAIAGYGSTAETLLDNGASVDAKDGKWPDLAVMGNSERA
ncbi:hypothetical protein GMORB2_5563 [Geosmithia morbida]|uniref:Ankyrin repeat protein n=1 Tax=Geosmithia morbida TaxID=1094350 RepID=A0A9P4YXY1_9HYPO|nr:uncharacterized protein GMORB2_5563 [Geosmithia morbida]KAF4123847.1 hypothetical protein GMORB2_5563 [Geosmithia morbida]